MHSTFLDCFFFGFLIVNFSQRVVGELLPAKIGSPFLLLWLLSQVLELGGAFGLVCGGLMVL